MDANEPTTEPLSALDRVSAEIRDRLCNYQPKTLDAAHWQEVRDEALELVAASGPGSAEHAKTWIGALSGFLAWRGPEGAAVAERLSEQAIETYIAHLISNGRSRESARPVKTSLRTLRRTLDGPQHRAPKPRRRRGAATYSNDEVDGFLAAAQDDRAPAGLGLSLAFGLGAGVVAPQALGARRSGDAEPLGVVLSGGELRPAVGRWSQLLAAVPPQRGLTGDDWARAREFAKQRGGVPGLDRHRLRATWLRAVLDEAEVPVAALLVCHPLDYKTIDGLRGRLAPIDDGPARQQLRAV